MATLLVLVLVAATAVVGASADDIYDQTSEGQPGPALQATVDGILTELLYTLGVEGNDSGSVGQVLQELLPEEASERIQKLAESLLPALFGGASKLAGLAGGSLTSVGQLGGSALYGLESGSEALAEDAFSKPDLANIVSQLSQLLGQTAAQSAGQVIGDA